MLRDSEPVPAWLEASRLSSTKDKRPDARATDCVHGWLGILCVCTLMSMQSGGGGIGSRPESDAERHSRLFNQLMDFGEHDLVLSGVHENVLGMR